jgi:hypothetical protein
MRVSPYTRIQEEFRQWIEDVLTRRRVTLDVIDQKSIDAGKAFVLKNLYERTLAAQQIGYTVEITASTEGLAINYVEALPATPDWY